MHPPCGPRASVSPAVPKMATGEVCNSYPIDSSRLLAPPIILYYIISLDHIISCYIMSNHIISYYIMQYYMINIIIIL